jgi:hypothetical protein
MTNVRISLVRGMAIRVRMVVNFKEGKVHSLDTKVVGMVKTPTFGNCQ